MTLALLVTAREAGAAAALAPVVRRLLDEGGRCRVHATEQAVAVFERAGLPVWALPDQQDGLGVPAALAAAAPDVLLTGTSVYPDRDARWWDAASAAGVPSLAVIDHWTPLVERFSHRRWFDCTPDAVTVLDEPSASALREAGAPFAVHVAGHPGLDEVAEVKPADAVRARRALDADAGRPLVVFISEPMRDHFGSALGHGPGGAYDEVSVLAAVREAVAGWRPDALVVVKLHPLEADTAHAGIGDEPPETRVLRAGDSRAILAAADVVLGMTSTMLVESAALGSLTISIRPGGGGPSFPSWASSIRALDDPAALGGALRAGAASAHRPLPAAGAARTVLDVARSLAGMPAGDPR